MPCLEGCLSDGLVVNEGRSGAQKRSLKQLRAHRLLQYACAVSAAEGYRSIQEVAEEVVEV